jgi:hypothetical protein
MPALIEHVKRIGGVQLRIAFIDKIPLQNVEFGLYTARESRPCYNITSSNWKPSTLVSMFIWPEAYQLACGADENFVMNGGKG